MSLLRKASIVTTPTAYENGKILSVKPSIVLGEELVVNGGFDTDSDWTKQTGWTIANGVATCDGTNLTQLYQTNVLTQNKTYKVTYSITSCTSGGVFAKLGNNTIGVTNSTVGTYTEYFNFTETNLSFHFRSSNFIGSIDNVSVKEDVSGDFTFSRNSSATRVNSQGLIEDVQILSSNLVSNGDFSQEGSELITNGDFSNGSTDWTLGTGWSIGANKVIGDGTMGGNDVVRQIINFSQGTTYRFSFTVLDYVSGGVFVRNPFNGYLDIASANGNYSFDYVAGINDYIDFRGNSFIGSVTNVSVKEVGQDWAIETGWSIGEDKAVVTNAPNLYQRLTQSSLSFTLNSTYKISITCSEYSTGFVYLRKPRGAESDTTLRIDNVGTFVFYVKALSEFDAFALAVGSIGTDLSISNISVIEITDDTNLPRIDYTGGEGHWLFEPQSTNLIITSDSGVYGSSPASGILTTAPDGTNTAVRPVPSSNSNRYTGQIIGGTYATNTKITYSWYRKRISTPVIDTYVGDLQPGILVNVTQVGSTIQIKSDINGFDKFSATFNITDGSLASNIRLYFGAIIGTGNSSVAYWGHQLEVGSYATSIIPTNGSTVTRLQDAAFGAGSSDLINSTEGVLYFEGSVLDISTPNSWISVSEDANINANQFNLRFVAGLNLIQAVSRAGGLGQDVVLQYTLSDKTTINKIAIKYKLNDWALWVNGIEVDTETSSVAFTLNSLDILDFDRGNNSSQFYGNVKCVAVFKEALTDEELECLTTI